MIIGSSRERAAIGWLAMLGQRLAQLGVVTDLTCDDDPGIPATFLLRFRLLGAEQKSLRLTAGAARMMWFCLTQFLFPEPAGLTAPEAAADMASDQLPIVSSITMDESPDGMIEIIALGVSQNWDLRFSREEGSHLWVDLEQALRHSPPGRAPSLFQEMPSALH
jgi:hypothetical protein